MRSAGAWSGHSRSSLPQPLAQLSPSVSEAPRFDAELVARISLRALRRLGLPESSIADATQDILITVHRRLPEFRGESGLATWIYGIVLRVAGNYRRSQARANAVIDIGAGAGLDDSASQDPSPFEQLARKDAAVLILELLDQLPSELRDVFVLVELEELSVQEASQALGCSFSTAKSRLRTARRLFECGVTRARAALTTRERSHA